MAPNRYAPYEASAGRRPKSSSAQRSNGTGRSAASVNRQKRGSAASGQTVGHYMLGKKIGEGTFGQVRQGTHILTGEKVGRCFLRVTANTLITCYSWRRYTHTLRKYDVNPQLAMQRAGRDQNVAKVANQKPGRH